MRILDIEVNDTTRMDDVKYKAINLFFGNAGCNKFLEFYTQCEINLCDASGTILNSAENFWSFVDKKGLVLSKTAFILKSKATDFEFDEGIPTQCNICHYSEFMTSFGNCLKCDMNIDTFDDYELTSNQLTNDGETLQQSILPSISRIKSNRIEIATKSN